MFLVFFQQANSSYEQAQQLLEQYGFSVRPTPEGLEADAGGFFFQIVLQTGPNVAIAAKEIGRSTPHEAGMRLCDAQFKVLIEDLDEALNEINTLMEVQGALQDASKGYLFLPWNGSLSAPYL